MIKKKYIKPSEEVIELQYKSQILAGSPDVYGMNRGLLNEEVDEGW